jgi:WD40 repeat protein
MKCVGCGTELGVGDRFCGECGLPRPSAPAPSSSASPQTPPPPVARAAARAPAVASNPAVRAELRQFAGHSAEVIKVAFSADRTRVWSADSAGAVKAWDIASGRSVAEFRHKRADAIDFSSDCGQALLGCGSDLLRVDLESGRVRAHFDIRQVGAWVKALAFMPDGRSALVATAESLRLIDLESGRALRRFDGHREPAEFVACAPNGSRAISGRFDPDAVDDGVLVWDLRSDRPPAAHRVGLASSAAFIAEGRFAIVGALDGQAHLIDTEAGRLVRALDAGGANVWCVAGSPADELFVLGAGTDELDADTMAALGQPDNDLLVWSTAHDRLVGRLSGAYRDVRSVAVSADGQLVAAGTNGHTVHVWSLS